MLSYPRPVSPLFWLLVGLLSVSPLCASDAARSGGEELRFQKNGKSLLLNWQDTGPGYQLQTVQGLPCPGSAVRWSNIPTGSAEETTVDASNGMSCFRLAAPTRLNHVLIVGQSLAVGAHAFALSTNQPFENRRFIGQRFNGLDSDLTALVPLTETWDPIWGTGETIASGFANWIVARVGLGQHDLLMSNCGRGGTAYTGLQRVPSGDDSQPAIGTDPYVRGLRQVAAALGLLGPKAYQFRAILAVHGESDFLTTNYDQDIAAWQADYQADIQQITGQTNPIPMFHSQPCSWAASAIAGRVWSPFKMLEEFEAHPDRTILVGPKYMLPYDSDALHLTAEGYRWLGEYYAKAYYHQIILGEAWSPLRPISITRTKNEITVAFTGVVGHLVFDTDRVLNPVGPTIDADGAPDGTIERVNVGPYGFEYWDDAGSGSPWQCSTRIRSVQLAGPARVRLILNQVPKGKYRRLRYAFSLTPFVGANITGFAQQAHGCLRDTDSTESLYGNELFNWCVHFDKPCP